MSEQQTPTVGSPVPSSGSPVAATTAPSRLPIDLVLPTSGLVMAETQSTTPVLCKPKILPIKSAALLKQREQQEQDATDTATSSRS
eukprot:m.199335 g.199335  ORF g.199335 m.199335 type:complete len:86 (-) comp20722_c0_seq1:129-386(-)